MSFLSQYLDATQRFQQAYVKELNARFQLAAQPGEVSRDPTRDWIPVRGLAAAAAAHRHLIITGASGAGKTTALLLIAAKHMRLLTANDSHARVPIYLSASELAGPLNIADLPRGLGLSPALAAQCPRDFFQSALVSGRAVVLIDDLDALSDDVARALFTEMGASQVIASSPTRRADWPEFYLSGWRDTDIQAAAQKAHGKNVSAFIETLKTSRVPRALTANPLTLALLVAIWRDGEPLPNNRTRLFDDYCQSILGSANGTARMLQDAALTGYGSKGTAGNTSPSNDLVAGRGFVKSGKDRTVEFRHALWQAYFAARALRLVPAQEAIAELVSDGRFQEALLFYAGMGDAGALIDALVSRGDFVLAGRALAQVGDASIAARERVTQELVRMAWEGDSAAVAALAELNSDSAVDSLGARLKDKDPLTRARGARILGQLGLDHAVDYLLPQLRETNGDVRDQVVAALGQARTDRVVEPLLVALRGESRSGPSDTRLRAAAARALGRVGSDKAVPALIVDLQIGEPEVREAAAEALKQMTSPLILKPLYGLAQAGDEETRRYAIDILTVVDGNPQ